MAHIKRLNEMVGANALRETIQIKKHPYMFEGQVTYGTLSEFCEQYENQLSKNEKTVRMFLDGNFNKKISDDCGRAAAFIGIGVEITRNNNFDIINVMGLRYTPYEGGYSEVDWFSKKWKDDGLLPISVDWDGCTYIEKYKYSGKDKNGIPKIAGTYWKRVPTFRYY